MSRLGIAPWWMAGLVIVGTGLSIGTARALQPAAAQAPVDLGSASRFAVLASSTVTNTGATTVDGDLGLFPGTAVTGFPPGTVNGTINAGDPIAELAQIDLTIAYNDAAGRSVDAVSVSGNLGGQTFTSGLYQSTSSLEISSGDLTLDALGDANAVFIFQVASTFITTKSRQVILSGGANASNVFWQVGSSATLGTDSIFKGNILALASITLATGVMLDGRALARTGAVALNANTITAFTFGDCTGDTLVDLTDFARFALCLGGPMQPPGDADGSCANLDHDGDADLGDFGRLLERFTIP